MTTAALALLPLLLTACHATAVSSSTAAAGPMSTSAATAFLKTGKTCCAALKLVLPGKVSYPDTTPYNSSIASYWSVQEETVHPTCVVSATTSQDVALSVFILTLGGQIFPGQCDFAVRSGGHTPFAGAANIQQGITIDLSALNQVTPSADLSTVTVGPGNRWTQVYLKLDALDIAIGGGRVGIVGVGGLTLGGGVVLASGLTVNVTQTSFPDLWVALKGGSNNFGIVTAFESTAFQQGKFWGGFIGNSIATKDAQFAAFEALNGSPNYDPYAALINSYVFTAATNSWYIANNIEYTKPQAYPPFFANFTSLPQTFSTMRISNLTDFTIELAASNPDGRRQLFVTGTYGNSAKMMSEIFNIANTTVQALIGVPNIAYSLSFQPEPTIITSKAASRGGNSLGLSAADGNLFNLLLTVSWDTQADDALITTQAKALFDQAETYAKQMGLYNKYLYLNYAAPWQDPIAGYGAAIVAQLKAVSKKYDPLGVFQTQVPGGFKLNQ
ncbi:hypothetical protein B0A55_03342 [Friedmanniomyces simplex]|uniref:FAD-binding PCMH-type domain-containing protein n=1 Tax=Friedmanniomyces simplex TaxID=329884 RepID=A0A4U0XL17_9PEZI|nr:hypothetical protein B0A55_03342 [Friedmanniomyces simplex]